MQPEHEKPTREKPTVLVMVVGLVTLGWALVYLSLYLFGT